MDKRSACSVCYFFFSASATTEVYPLSLHDALPIWSTAAATPPSAGCRAATSCSTCAGWRPTRCRPVRSSSTGASGGTRSEEHTSELQSRQYLVCRLLLEKKKIRHRESGTTPRATS